MIKQVLLANKLTKKTSDPAIPPSQSSDLVCKVRITLSTTLRISTRKPHLPQEEMSPVPCTMIHKKFRLLMLSSILRKTPINNKHQLALLPRMLRLLRRKNSNQLLKLRPKKLYLNSKGS